MITVIRYLLLVNVSLEFAVQARAKGTGGTGGARFQKCHFQL